MKRVATSIEGVFVIEPRSYADARGYFCETFRESLFGEMCPGTQFVQENEAYSCGSVLRGLHCQVGGSAQAKLVRVVRGSVLDVAVDLRWGSPTFGRYVAEVLSADNRRQLFIPRGFGHGYRVLSEEALFLYKCDNYYDASSEAGVRWDDPRIGIDWGLGEGSVAPLISDKDRDWPLLDSLVEGGEIAGWFPYANGQK